MNIDLQSFKDHVFEKKIQLQVKVLPDQKLLYFKIAKTASTAIWNRCFLDKKVKLHVLCYKINNDLWNEWFNNLTEETFKEYKSFTFVRNPYDRLVSAYLFLRRRDISFEKFIAKHFKKSQEIIHDHLYPQAYYLHINNKPYIDYVGRYENLQDDYSKLLLEFNLDKLPVKLPPHSTSSRVRKSIARKGRRWEGFYTQELRDRVYDIYKEDFKILNYGK